MKGKRNEKKRNLPTQRSCKAEHLKKMKENEKKQKRKIIKNKKNKTKNELTYS